MNGDNQQRPAGSGQGWGLGSAASPPSLSEPSLPTPAVPAAPLVPSVPEPTAISAIPNTAAVREPASGLSGQQSEGFYHPETVGEPFNETPDKTNTGDEQPLEWVSSGEELQERSATWRIRMTLASVVAGGLIYLVTRDAISTGGVVISGLLFGLLGARRPSAISYRLDGSGILVGEKRYVYNQFRAFSLASDEHVPSINLIPLKRFSPVLSIRYNEELRDDILNALAHHLPLETPRNDAFDSIINRLKF